MSPLEGPLGDLRGDLLEWFDSHRRPMPWRGVVDPYKTWVSEIMLQQTQVATVTPYYDRFMERFPTVEALAEADIQDVLVLWAGLGYYSRARNLHAAAQRIVSEFWGLFPDTLKGARSLPGVGEYTAGAILSIAYGECVPAVDGNVERIVCRLWEIEGAPKKPPARERIRQIATALAQCEHPGDLNQALMELGATVCSPRAPMCADCPVAAFCLARDSGCQEELPQTPPRRKAVRVHNAAALVRDAQGRFLVARRAHGAVWGGLWEFPQAEDVGSEPEARLTEHLQARLGIEAGVGAQVLQIKHGVMDMAITLRVYECRYEECELTVDDYAEARWVEVGEMDEYPFSSPHKKIVKYLQEAGKRLGLGF